MKKILGAVLIVLGLACGPAETPQSQGSVDPGAGLPDVPSLLADGTQAHPQLVSAGATFSGKVGSKAIAADKTSYYQFDSGTMTQALLTIRATNPTQTNRTPYRVHLASHPAYGEDHVLQGNRGTETWELGEEAAAVFPNLTPHRTYYFQVINEQDSTAITYDLRLEAAAAALSEGHESVITLVDGAVRSSFTGKSSFDEPGDSRYQFNTGAHTSVTLSFQLSTVGYEVNSVAIGNFAGLKAEKFARSGVTTRTLTGLAQNTTYFLSTYSLLETDNQLRYNLNLTLN